MRIAEVKVHNFRSILDITCKLESLSLIAGANNTGKSNLIDAIRMFYGDIKWSEDKDMPKAPTEDVESWIEIEFTPSKDEISQLKDEYKTKDDTFRVRNYLKSTSLGSDGKVRAGYYAYVDGKLSETLFYGAKNVASGKVGKIVYIPAVSKVDDHTKLSGPSALRDLVANVLTKVISGSKAYKKLTTAFVDFESEIKVQESEDGKSLKILEKEITSELEPWETDFNLEIQSIQTDDLIKSLVKPQLFDKAHGGEIDQARFGAGFQRNLIYVLIKLAAKYAAGAKLTKTVKKEFSPDLTLILFEEPEAFLHPTQEDILYESLLALSEDSDSQILLTTHSSRFVSRTMGNLTRLIRLRRDNAITTSYQINNKELDTFFDVAHALDIEIKPALLDPKSIDAQKSMSVFKLELWLQPQRSTAFFSKWVILVEGQSEVGMYAYLTSRKLMAEPTKGLVVVDCMGKYNIHRFMLLLNAFGVDHSVLYDGDDGDAHDKEVSSAITSSKGDFTHCIKRFDGDLESELGLAQLPKDQGNRKPQYILYNLEAGLIKKDKLDEMIKVFNELCVRAED